LVYFDTSPISIWKNDTWNNRASAF
jgi:hypothetical protein